MLHFILNFSAIGEALEHLRMNPFSTEETVKLFSQIAESLLSYV